MHRCTGFESNIGRVSRKSAATGRDQDSGIAKETLRLSEVRW